MCEFDWYVNPESDENKNKALTAALTHLGFIGEELEPSRILSPTEHH